MAKEKIGFGGEQASINNASRDQGAESAPVKERIGFIQQELEQKEKDASFEVAGFGRELKPHKHLEEDTDSSLFSKFANMYGLEPEAQKKVDDFAESLLEREAGLYAMITRTMDRALDMMKNNAAIPAEDLRYRIRGLDIQSEIYADAMRKIADAFHWRLLILIASRSYAVRMDEAAEWEEDIDRLREELREEMVTIEAIVARWASETQKEQSADGNNLTK